MCVFLAAELKEIYEREPVQCVVQRKMKEKNIIPELQNEKTWKTKQVFRNCQD